jgi:HK97 family phage major capsid protein
MSNFLFDRLRPQSVLLRSGVRVIATDRDAIQLPKLVADVAPGFYNELQAITPSDPTFAALTATPRKLAALVQMSNEIIDDSEPSIVDLLNSHIATILALRLDLAAFEGSGTAPEIRGLKNISGIQTISAGANGASLANLDLIADAITALEGVNATASAIVMPSRTWGAIRRLKETTNQYLVTPGGPAAAATRTLFGVPVLVSGQLSVSETQGTATTASSIYVYDASQLVLVRRQDASIELDRSRLFHQDGSELRATLRADLLAPNPTAIVRIAGVTAA